MKALVLAAGRGSRMRERTDARPKCLMEFAGRTLLDWQVSALRRAGVEEIHLVRGYLGGSFEGRDLVLWENPQWEFTNMVVTLFCARGLLETAESLLVCYGDIVYEPRVATAAIEAKGDVAVVVDRRWRELWEARSDDPLADAESLRMDGCGRIVDIGRKVSDIESIEAQYIGLLRFTRAGLDRLIEFFDRAREGDPWLMGRSLARCYMTDLVRGLIDSGIEVNSAPIDGGWVEFDTVEDHACYERLRERGELERFVRLEEGAWSSG